MIARRENHKVGVDPANGSFCSPRTSQPESEDDSSNAPTNTPLVEHFTFQNELQSEVIKEEEYWISGSSLIPKCIVLVNGSQHTNNSNGWAAPDRRRRESKLAKPRSSMFTESKAQALAKKRCKGNTHTETGRLSQKYTQHEMSHFGTSAGNGERERRPSFLAMPAISIFNPVSSNQIPAPMFDNQTHPATTMNSRQVSSQIQTKRCPSSEPKSIQARQLFTNSNSRQERPSGIPRLTSPAKSKRKQPRPGKHNTERLECHVDDDDDDDRLTKAKPLCILQSPTQRGDYRRILLTRKLKFQEFATIKPSSTSKRENTPIARTNNNAGTRSSEAEKKKSGVEARKDSRKDPQHSSEKSGSEPQSKDTGATTLDRKQALVTTSPPVSRSTWLSVFLLLCLFRIINVFLVQSYFDPDEFWQTLEPAYCAAFATNTEVPCPGLTWEWKRRAPDDATNFLEQCMLGPVRTYLSVLPTYALYRIARALSVDASWVISRGPMFLYAVTVAAPVDLAVWYSARWLQPPEGRGKKMILPGWCLFCSLTSWFNGFSLVRTFANSQETEFLILAVALVSPELLGNVNARFGFPRACFAFLLGGLSAAIRFTALAAFVPMGVLLALRNHSPSARFGYLIVPCAVFGITGLGIAMAVDRYFFGFWTIPFLGNFHFNVVQDMARIYGSHPWHWYLTAGVPALSGMLLPFLLVELCKFVRGCSSNGEGYGERNLWSITISYVCVLSFAGHKEFRFIHPVLPLFCLLSGDRIRRLFAGKSTSRFRKNLFVSAFTVANLIALLYLGLFHQAGPILVNRKILEVSRQVAGSNSPTATSSRSFSVYYLTGGCHSTPLYSHLHAPPLTFDTWSLDCSPDCRSDPAKVCEAQQFARDPSGFFKEFLCFGDKLTCKAESSPSSHHRRPVPDYVVTISEFAQGIQPQLESIGFEEVARFPHHITGARLVDTMVVGDYYYENHPSYNHISILNKMLEVSVEDVILFSRHRVNA